jgi:hypothetical protein|tara:strand:+ start:129 stop:482 length:354 start_codon:yes stop_codon:yes gene_type:complete
MEHPHISQSEYIGGDVRCPCCDSDANVTEEHGEVMDNSYQRDMRCEQEGCGATWTESYQMGSYTVNEHGSTTRTVEVEAKILMMFEVGTSQDDASIYERAREELAEVATSVEQLDIQ